MANYYDAYGRPQRAPISEGRRVGPSASRPPTLDDYQRLVESYTQLTQRSTKWEEERRKADERIQGLEGELAKARQDLDDCQNGKNGEEDTWKERFIRLQAEMENLRKRTEQRYAAQADEQRRGILLDMLPLADHLEMALQHGTSLTDPAAVDFLGNIQATQQAFLSVLKRYGVEPIPAAGAAFDPTLHEALGHMPSPDVAAEYVAHVVQTGYTEGERLLRPARVMVSAGPAQVE
ncbi:MAG: nucleotide exchange factor GrpE [Caldilineaceae bacterium]|nr:nucleotide exchange factor GrpE [Caldilineaceae bacterium]MBP8106024.1 nucleotide exchange factor GrpE [Caldilineaceae bacterium]MBP8123114.1 nucleotide exchange factor GrpE [Caldilineaceae bacterium]MBP9071944.1 nucleotide exchange factor GrpE [Caldilineaceae bacterium]